MSLGIGWALTGLPAKVCLRLGPTYYIAGVPTLQAGTHTFDALLSFCGLPPLKLCFVGNSKCCFDLEWFVGYKTCIVLLFIRFETRGKIYIPLDTGAGHFWISWYQIEELLCIIRHNSRTCVLCKNHEGAIDCIACYWLALSCSLISSWWDI